MELTRVSSPLSCAFSAASSARNGSTSTRTTSVPSTRRASDSPAAPTPAPSSTTRSPARAGHAAAKRIASWPTRCPLRGCLSRSLPPSTASSATSARIRTELVSETGVLQQFTRLVVTTLVDQDTAREDADRTFKHAHVLVEHDVGDVSGIEQSRHRGNQHGIIGAYEFAPIIFVGLVIGLLQRLSSSTLAPAVLLAGRRLLQIGDQLYLPATAGHRIKDQACDDRERRQQHQAGGQNRSRNARYDAFLEVSHEDGNGETHRDDREHNAEPGKERQRPLRTVKVDDREQNSQAIAPGAELRSRSLRARVVRGRDLGHCQFQFERVHGKFGLDLEAPRQHGERLHEPAREHAISRENIAEGGVEGQREKPRQESISGAMAEAVGGL